jgi:hypothetical protein
VTQFSPPALPPLSAEYADTLHAATEGATPQQFLSKLHRSANGTTRTDFGQSSIINDVAKKQTIFLDHAKKEAKIMPMGQAALPQMPQAPSNVGAMPAMPAPPPPMNVQDLGKRLIAGHEVMGKKYTFQPPPLPQVTPPPMPETPEAPKLQAPALPGVPPPPKLPGVPTMPAVPQMPAMPQVPKAPALPGAPPIPQMPAAPQPPPAPLPPTEMEVWTSTSLFIPMLSRMKGGVGQRISQCTNPIKGEPPPATFQIPPDYKLV